MTLTPVTEREFEKEVLREELPVLVDLYADWCSPCKQLEPILQRLSTELEGKLKIVRIDVEKSPNLARALQVRSIPMMVLFSGGRPVDQRVGLLDESALMEFVRPLLPTPSNEIEPKQLAALVAQNRVLPVDIRESTAFGRYRIPGAINLPASQIMEHLEDVRPTDGRLRVLYSRSTDDAKETADKISEQGIQVAYLKGGFLHWEADGLAVERGE